MTSIKEVIYSFFENARDRLKNPVIGAFIFSWLALNWRIALIILFSNKTIEARIETVENNYVDVWINLYIPLLVALFYILILPYLMALVDSLSRWAVVLRKTISKNHRISDIKDKQEIAAEEWQLDIIRAGSPDVSNLKNKIAELEKEIQQKDDQIKQFLNKGLEIKTESESHNFEESSTKENSSSKKASRKISRKPTKASTDVKPTVTYSSKSFPVMKDVVIRDMAKTETEWILLYAFYSSNFGEKEFQRDSIMVMYDESNRKTTQRIKNVSTNIKSLIKQGLIRYINEEDMLLTDVGKQKAKDILNR